MPLQVGIVGLPNAGKTTLFNALTHAGAEVTAYAAVTEKANVGMAVIADADTFFAPDRAAWREWLAGPGISTPVAPVRR